MTVLVVVVGPIASGKSTTANALADRLAGPDRLVVAVDLDDVVFAQRAPLDEHGETWARGRRVHAALVGAWFAEGVDVVVAHGPLQHDPGLATLLAAVPAGTDVVRVLLQVSFEAAVTRVLADPTRVFSRDLDFLRECHDRFAVLHPDVGPFDRTYRTDEVTVDAVVDDLVGVLP